MSISVTTLDSQKADPEPSSAADRALYARQGAGRNKVCASPVGLPAPPVRPTENPLNKARRQVMAQRLDDAGGPLAGAGASGAVAAGDDQFVFMECSQPTSSVTVNR